MFRVTRFRRVARLETKTISVRGNHSILKKEYICIYIYTYICTRRQSIFIRGRGNKYVIG